MDLRIIEYESEFYIHHGVLGPKVPLILEDIFNFLSDDKVTHELVIVAASNMRQMDDNSHAKFMDLVENTLGKFLFQNGGNYESLLHTIRLQDIVDQGPKILFIYDDKYLDKHPNPNPQGSYLQSLVKHHVHEGSHKGSAEGSFQSFGLPLRTPVVIYNSGCQWDPGCASSTGCC